MNFAYLCLHPRPATGAACPIASCPLMGQQSQLPANPFIARIECLGCLGNRGFCEPESPWKSIKSINMEENGRNTKPRQFMATNVGNNE